MTTETYEAASEIEKARNEGWFAGLDEGRIQGRNNLILEQTEVSRPQKIAAAFILTMVAIGSIAWCGVAIAALFMLF